jgi:hypothetical protein
MDVEIMCIILKYLVKTKVKIKLGIIKIITLIIKTNSICSASSYIMLIVIFIDIWTITIK